MSRKSFLLFLFVCLLGGIGTFLGSGLGNAFGKTGLNTGAIIGGIVRVAVATKLAVRRKILGPKRYWPATVGGVLGLLLAAVIATNNMSTPIVPLLSILLIGFGAVVGAGTRHGKSI